MSQGKRTLKIKPVNNFDQLQADADRQFNKSASQSNDPLMMIDPRNMASSDIKLDRPVIAKNAAQKAAFDGVLKCVYGELDGPGGTSKTFTALAAGVYALLSGTAKNLIVTRPAVEAQGERLGFIPGDVNEKIAPYLRPIVDDLADMIGHQMTAQLLESKIIQVEPLAYLRGRTLNGFVIVDEAQNVNNALLEMMITRLGPDGQMVFAGDANQVDIQLKHRELDGMTFINEALRARFAFHAATNPEMAAKFFSYSFSKADIVRHPLIAEMLDECARIKDDLAAGKTFAKPQATAALAAPKAP